MLSTLVSFVVLVWLRHNQFFCDCARGGMVSSTLEEMAFVFERAYSTALETNKMWYACSDKFCSSQVVTGFSKEIRRVRAENIGAKQCVSPGICEAARSNPQVRNSYRVGRRVYAPAKIPVFVSVNKFRTPLGVCRPVAIEYQTPLRISGTCFPRTAGNIEHEACHAQLFYPVPDKMVKIDTLFQTEKCETRLTFDSETAWLSKHAAGPEREQQQRLFAARFW